MAKKIAYIRVSSADQKTDRQLDGMTFDKKFEEKVSGKSIDRPQLQAMLEYIRKDEGDEVYVHELSRLGRSLIDLHKIVDQILAKGASVHFVKENLSFSPGNDNDPVKQAMFGMLAVFSQFERSLIKQRQAEGIAKAKAAGKHLGRPSILTDQQKQEIREKRKAGANPTQLSKEYGISRALIYKIAGKSYNSVTEATS